MNLAFTGAIKDEIMDIETLGLRLVERLTTHYAGRLEERYGIEVSDNGLETMEAIALRRGNILKGREPDWTRTAVMLLDEFRAASWGKFHWNVREIMLLILRPKQIWNQIKILI